ncbi:hypothetical protein LC612_43360 [Nostoc sp. CHAB 5834]|nr:hypothetical protein [Nostoc sp. CHAB 5834]
MGADKPISVTPVNFDYWIERLIRLRRTHLNQWITLTNREIHYRRALTQQFQQEKQHLYLLYDLAVLIQQQTCNIQALDEQKQARKQALQTRQAREIYELLQLKIRTQTIANQAILLEG